MFKITRLITALLLISFVTVTSAQLPKILWQNTWDINFSIPQQATFSSDSKYFAMGYAKGDIVVFESATGNVLTNYHLHSRHVYCTVFQPGGNLLVSADKDGFVVIYDYIANKEVKTFSAHDKVITAITFSADGKLLITGSKDNTIKLWNPETGALMSTIDDVQGNIQALRITPDNKTIVAGTSALMKGLRLFDAGSGRQIRTFESPNVQLLDVSRDGNYMATANLKKFVMLFDLKKYSPAKELHGHTKWMTDVAFSPTSKVLYSSSEDKTVIAWDIAKLKSMGVMFSAKKKIASIACSPDGNFLAVMDESNTFSILDISKVEDSLK